MRATARHYGLLAACAVMALAGCVSADTSASGDGRRTLVLADGAAAESLNPVAGHGATGSSKIYEGLLALAPAERTAGAESPGVPDLVPRLAADLPEPDGAARMWTVRLRDDVVFHDGSTLDAADVVATFRAVIDPAVASPLATAFTMLDAVEEVDEHTVQFRLTDSYVPFPSLLLLGILPSELVEAGPVGEWEVNTAPVGSGAYRFASRRGEEVVVEAFAEHRDGAPHVARLVTSPVTDDAARAQRMTAGDFDGATLPPRLAATFEGREEYRVVAHPSADFRAVTLPTDHPVTGDDAVRLAVNLAVDREAIVRDVLLGYGTPAATPVPPALGEFHEPGADFEFDPAAARSLLDDAGWRLASDGVRERDGVRADFTVMYFPEDTLRRDLASVFASQLLEIGIEVRIEAAPRPVFGPRLAGAAGVLGGGDHPYDPDTLLFPLLHSSFAADDVGGVFDNPSRYRNRAVDAALERGRTSLDPVERVESYRAVQREYVLDPAMVTLVFLDHVYVMRSTDLTGQTPILEPHSHGVDWGPWWNVARWQGP